MYQYSNGDSVCSKRQCHILFSTAALDSFMSRLKLTLGFLPHLLSWQDNEVWQRERLWTLLTSDLLVDNRTTSFISQLNVNLAVALTSFCRSIKNCRPTLPRHWEQVIRGCNTSDSSPHYGIPPVYTVVRAAIGFLHCNSGPSSSFYSTTPPEAYSSQLDFRASPKVFGRTQRSAVQYKYIPNGSRSTVLRYNQNYEARSKQYSFARCTVHDSVFLPLP